MTKMLPALSQCSALNLEFWIFPEFREKNRISEFQNSGNISRIQKVWSATLRLGAHTSALPA